MVWYTQDKMCACVCFISQYHTTDEEKCIGLFSLRARHTLEGVVVCVLLGDVQSTLHLTLTKGRLCHHGNIWSLQLCGVGQV